MERIEPINTERIAWCCADYGVSPGELAAKVGIPENRLNRVMAGEEGMTFVQLQKVAGYFGRGLLFFLEPGPVNLAKVHTAQFRTLANEKPDMSPNIRKLVERVEKQREVYISLLEEMDEGGRLNFAPLKLPSKDSREAARIAREWLCLPEKTNFNTYRSAVEARGILVFRSNGFSGNWQIPKENPILGFTLYDQVCPVIVVKKLRGEAPQSFTLMHEMGHLLLHESSSIDDEGDMDSCQEKESVANAFAGHLLVPDDFLGLVSDATRPVDVADYDLWLEKHRKVWGVSTEVILRRLMDSGRLEKNQYESYRKWRVGLNIPRSEGGAARQRYREPGHVFGDTFVRTVLEALSAQRITLSRASSYLDGLKIKDLHLLEKHYAGL